MWYEIIPTWLITYVGIAFPGYALYYCHGFFLGNNYRRTLLDRWDRTMYQRDTRVTGNPYKVNGLDAIPDE